MDIAVTPEDFSVIQTDEGQIQVKDLCGWLPELARESFDLIPRLQILGQQAPSGQPRRSMLWELARKVLGSDTTNYRQLRGDCVTVDTKVLMANGEEKFVNKILIGDTVLNHKNEPAKVIDIVSKLYTGEMITIKVKGHDRKLTATATHDSLILPYNTQRFIYKGTSKSKFGEYSTDGKKQYALIPFGSSPEESITLDLTKYIDINKSYSYDSDYLYYKDQPKVNRFVKIDNKFARFVGLYLAEGGVTHNNVNFSFNSNELLYIKDIEVLTKEIFGDLNIAHYTPETNCTRVAIKSIILRNFIINFIEGNIHSKTIPKEFFRVKTSVKLDLLKGWLDGYGYKNFSINSVIGYTTSSQLGIDMHRIALSCRINARSKSRMRKQRAKMPVTEVALFSGESYKIYQEENYAQDRRGKHPVACNDTPYGFAREIIEVTREYVENKAVYCITTDGEHTIIANGIATYNCTSFMGKNSAEYVQLYPIANGDRFTFTPIFPPYIYGTERVFVGNQRGSMSDGGLGRWVATSVQKYGVLPSNAPNCPPYSSQIAAVWGANGPPDSFIEIGKQHIIKSVASVATVEDVKDALMNFYPVGICSSIGYDMLPRSDGFHHYSTTWNHAMTIIGFDDGDPSQHIPECFTLLNNWGDVHGALIDFRTKEKWPVGTLRISAANLQRMLDQNDSFTFSSLEGFPAQDLPREQFGFIL